MKELIMFCASLRVMIANLKLGDAAGSSVTKLSEAQKRQIPSF